jgi:3',5'-cyclic AMP phosphodiesterase CpdA/tetratricopeptide (TPR) repeat protein
MSNISGAKKLFVIMPFGLKRLPSGLMHDFDRFYHGILRPVAQDAGWSVFRADEITEPGTIVNQAFRHLQAADVVVADISSPNGSVYYELGVRQAISPGKTILVAVHGTELPFDLKSQRVLFYSPQFDQDPRFRFAYREALISDSPHVHNPVRDALSDLGLNFHPRTDRIAFEQELHHKIERSRNIEQLLAVWHWARQSGDLPTGALLSLSNRLAAEGDYASAVQVLDAAFPEADGDWEVHRQRGFYLRKLTRLDAAEVALNRAYELNPSDPETLGMLGGALKRQGRYAEALGLYQQGATLSPTSLYLAVACAGMMAIADPGNPEPALARYRQVLDEIDSRPGQETDSWANLVRAEAHFVLGDVEAARRFGRAAVRYGAERLHLESTADQILMLHANGLPLRDADGFARWLVDGARDPASTTVEERGAPATDPDFPRRMIFHISDVHFGSITEGGSRIDVHRFADTENSDRLSVELTREFHGALKRSGCAASDAVLVVSGDSTYTGRQDEFDLVRQFLTELCENTGMDRSQVVLVPGNHDIDWLQTKSNRANRFDNYLTFAHQFYGEELFHEVYPRIEWDLRTSGTRPEAREIVYRRTDRTMTVVGLNSCIFEDDQNHYGYIGKRQLDIVKDLLEQEPPENVRVAVMHHHLHPFPEPLEPRRGDAVVLDLSTVRDAGLVEQRLERLGFSLLLHGHKHKPQLRETLVRIPQNDSSVTPRPLIVSGCGSTGVSQHELEHNQPNHFAVLELAQPVRMPGADFLVIEWRELAVAPGAEWVTKQRWTIKG